MPIIELESIGDDQHAYFKDLGKFLNRFNFRKYDFDLAKNRPWVAEITDLDKKFKFKRTFLKSHKDYICSNSKGSRGIYLVFNVKNGLVYERFERTSWKKTYRCFFRYKNNKEIEMSENEVIEWLKNR